MPPYKRGSRHRKQPAAAGTPGEKVYPVSGNDRFTGTQEDLATPSSGPDAAASQSTPPPLVVYTSRRRRSSWKAQLGDSDLRREMLPPPDPDDQGSQKLGDSLEEIKLLRKRKRSNSAKPGPNLERESSLSGGKRALKSKGPGHKVRAKSVLGSLLFAEVNEAPEETAHEALEPVERARFKNVLCRRDGLSEYLECRNFITSIWERHKGKSITLTECGVTLSSSKEDTPRTRLLREVFGFLDDNGYINSSTSSASKSKPRAAGRPKGSKNRKFPSKALEFGRGGGSRRGGVFNVIVQSQRTSYDGAEQSVRQVLNQGSLVCKSDVQLALEREQEPTHATLEFNCESMDAGSCETSNSEKIEPEIEPGSSKENSHECKASIRGETDKKMVCRIQVGEEPKCVIDAAPLETSGVDSSPLGNLVKKFSRRSKSKKRDSETQLEMVPVKRVNSTPEGTVRSLTLRNSVEITSDQLESRSSVMDLGAGIKTRLVGDVAFDSSPASCNDVDSKAPIPLGSVTMASVPAKATLVADLESDGLLDVEEELATRVARTCRLEEKLLPRRCGYRQKNRLEILSKQPAGNLHVLNCYSDAEEHVPRPGPLVGGSLSRGELLIHKVDEVSTRKSNCDGNRCSSKRHVDLLPCHGTDDWTSQVGGRKLLVVHAGNGYSFFSSNLVQIRPCLSKKGIVTLVPSDCYGALSKVVIEPPLVFCVKILVNSMESKTGLAYSRAASGYPIMGNFVVEGSVARLAMEGCYALSSFGNLSQNAMVRNTSTHTATNNCLVTSTPRMCREVSMWRRTGDCLHFCERIQLIRAFMSGAKQAFGTVVVKEHLFHEEESRGRASRRIENSEAAELNDRCEGEEVLLEALKPLDQEACSSSDAAHGELVGSANGAFVCKSGKGHEHEVKPLIFVLSKDAHVESEISKPPGTIVLEHSSSVPDSVEHVMKPQSTEYLTMAVAKVDMSRSQKRVHIVVDPQNRGQSQTDDRVTPLEFMSLGSFSDVTRVFSASAGRELEDSIKVDPLLGTAEEGGKEARGQASACVALEDKIATRSPVIKAASVGNSAIVSSAMVRDDDLLCKDPKQWNTEHSHAVHRQSTDDRIEVREMLRKLAILNSSSTKPTKKVELLQEMFDCAKTTGGRHLLAKELLRLPPTTVKEIVGSHQGLTVLNTWILDSVDKEGTQLLRLCMRLLLIVADNLSSIRQTGIGRTVKDKVLGHSCHDVQALANQLGKIWVESSRKGKTPLHMKQPNNYLEQRKSAFIAQPRIENSENRSKFRSHSSVGEEHDKSRVGMESLAVREEFRVVDGSKVSSLSKISDGPTTSCKIGGEDIRNSCRRVSSREESVKQLPSWHDRKEVVEALPTEHLGFEVESSSGAGQKDLPVIVSFRKFARQEQSVGIVTKKKAMVAENADLLDLRDKRPFPAGDEDRKQKVRSWAIDFSLTSLLGCLSLTSGCNNVSNISAPPSIVGHLGGFPEQSMEDLNSPPSVNVKKQRNKLHGIVEDTPLRLDSASKLQIREEQTPSVSISGNEQSIGGSQNANESFSGASPHSLRNMVQVRGVSIGSRASSPGSSEAHKETSKGLEIKDAVSEYVRQLLMPLLKTKKLQKDGIKYIHKKTVTKVMERSTELDMAMSVSEFLDTKRKIKIRSLVDKLVERFLEDQYH